VSAPPIPTGGRKPRRPVDPQAAATAGLHRARGFDAEITQLKAFLDGWRNGASEEMRPMLRWQFLGRSKYFRPATVFACCQAMAPGPIGPEIIQRAAAVEMMHNVSLIVDDILDRSRYRRGVQTLHCRFGQLPALMASGYISAEAFRLCRDYPFGIDRLAELLERLAAAESIQWRLRRQPLGIEDWRFLAGEDTGTMFEACACLGTGDQRLRQYGRLLGMLYHGCDDVGDVRGAVALGGGGDEDLRDGIVTLPVAIAIRDPAVAVLFRDPTPADLQALVTKVGEALPEAERYLDALADEATAEARRVAPNPDPLIDLVRNTRPLSH
jgi:geranylgeranyl pyrophosphate synthase